MKEEPEVSLGRHRHGRDLGAGDVLRVWWKPYRELILRMEAFPADSPTLQLIPGARWAVFADGGQTIDPDGIYEMYVPDHDQEVTLEPDDARPLGQQSLF